MILCNIILDLYCVQNWGGNINKTELEIKLKEMLLDLKLDEKSKNTLKKYSHNVKIFIDMLPTDKDIDKLDILEVKDKLINSEFKTSTINSYIVSINKFLKYCDLKDLYVKQIKQQANTTLESVISKTDFDRLLRYAKRSGRLDMYYIMKILGCTGIRISELKFFTVENLKTNYIVVKNKGKERVVPVRQDLLRELRKYARDRKIKKGRLFTICESTIWRQLKRIAGIARVSKNKVHAHSFRHYFAKTFLEAYNGNVLELADILGHNQLDTTRIYARTTAEEKRKHIEQIKF